MSYKRKTKRDPEFIKNQEQFKKEVSENIIIELKGLTKRYGYGDTESFALKDFDLTISSCGYNQLSL